MGETQGPILAKESEVLAGSSDRKEPDHEYSKKCVEMSEGWRLVQTVLCALGSRAVLGRPCQAIHPGVLPLMALHLSSPRERELTPSQAIFLSWDSFAERGCQCHLPHAQGWTPVLFSPGSSREETVFLGWPRGRGSGR